MYNLRVPCADGQYKILLVDAVYRHYLKNTGQGKVGAPHLHVREPRYSPRRPLKMPAVPVSHSITVYLYDTVKDAMDEKNAVHAMWKAHKTREWGFPEDGDLDDIISLEDEELGVGTVHLLDNSGLTFQDYATDPKLRVKPIAIGRAHCSVVDQFNRKLGFELALGRALADLGYKLTRETMKHELTSSEVLSEMYQPLDSDLSMPVKSSSYSLPLHTRPPRTYFSKKYTVWIVEYADKLQRTEHRKAAKERARQKKPESGRIPVVPPDSVVELRSARQSVISSMPERTSLKEFPEVVDDTDEDFVLFEEVKNDLLEDLRQEAKIDPYDTVEIDSEKHDLAGN